MKSILKLLLLLFCCRVSAQTVSPAAYREDTISSVVQSDSIPEYVRPEIPAEQWDQLIGKDFPYATERETQLKASPPGRETGILRFFTKLAHWFSSPAGKWLLWGLFALMILIVFAKWMLPDFVLMLRRGRSAAALPMEETTDKLWRKESYAGDWETYVQSGDYRNATRAVYLTVLHELADEGLIQLRADATDYDYYEALGEHRVKPMFRRLLLQYHYAWFGALPLSEAQWEATRILFDDIKALLRT